MPKKTLLLASTAVVLTILVLYAGLALRPHQDQRQTPALGAKQSERTMHVAMNEWVGFAPFFLAKEKGFFGDLNVEMEFVALEGDKRAGLYSGRFDVICESMDMFQTNRDSQDYPGKIAFALDESYGGDGVLAVKEVRSLADLKGRTAVAEPGQPAHFVLQYLLNQKGMTLKDVHFQQMGSAEAASAFMAGKVDVAGTYEPYLSKALQKRPGAHLLVSSKDLPGVIVDVAIMKDETLRNRRGDVEQLYTGWCKAVTYYNEHHDEAVSIMARAFKQTPKEFDESASGLRYFDAKRNVNLFGAQNQPGPVFNTFSTVGNILRTNELTKGVDSPGARIYTGVVNTTAK